MLLFGSYKLNIKKAGSTELERKCYPVIGLINDWDKNGKISSKSIHQYGAATMRTDSPHYSDQSLLFSNRELKDVWFNKEDILKNLESKYRPGERNEN